MQIATIPTRSPAYLVDLRTAQKLLRHANSRITMEIYQQSLSDEKRLAQTLVFSKLFEEGSAETLQHPKDFKKAEVIALNC